MCDPQYCMPYCGIVNRKAIFLHAKPRTQSFRAAACTCAQYQLGMDMIQHPNARTRGEIRFFLHVCRQHDPRHDGYTHPNRATLSQKRCVSAASIPDRCAQKDAFAQLQPYSRIKYHPVLCGHSRYAYLQCAHTQSQTRLLKYAQSINETKYLFFI